jgi:hypothetical protein
MQGAAEGTEARRKDLEQQLAVLPQATAMAPVDRDHVARELRTRADDMRGVLRQGAQAREALRTLLLDRFDGTFGGLLAASTWPTTFGGPNGPPSLVAGLLTFSFVGEARAA